MARNLEAQAKKFEKKVAMMQRKADKFDGQIEVHDEVCMLAFQRTIKGRTWEYRWLLVAANDEMDMQFTTNKRLVDAEVN